MGLFALCFPLAQGGWPLLASTGALLGLALVRFHERGDLRMVGYYVLLGTVVEGVGVRAGLWRFPDAPILGFPLWYATMWGGVGLLVRRVFLPLVSGRSSSPAEGARSARCVGHQPREPREQLLVGEGLGQHRRAVQRALGVELLL